jgi:hypothetical protein
MAAYPVLPSVLLHGVGIPEYLPLTRQGIYFTAQYPTCTSPCRRFDAALASGSARLGAVVIRSGKVVARKRASNDAAVSTTSPIIPYGEFSPVRLEGWHVR